MSGKPAVTAIVVNWKSPGDTLRLVESLLPDVADGLRFVILENGSNDDSDAILRQRFAAPSYAGIVTYLTSETNIGFCAGVNRCVAAALAADPKPDYLWFLNPDIYPPDGLLAAMLGANLESGCPIVTARAGGGEGFSGEDRWPWAYVGPKFTWQTKPHPDRSWWVTGRYHGGCVLWESSLVEQLIQRDGEFLHEPFFMYWDEWDTSVRATRFSARVAVANVFVRHHSDSRNATPGLREARTYYLSRNAVIMGRRHFSWWQRPVVVPLQVARGFVYYCLLHRLSPRAYLSGILDGLRGKSGIWKHHPR